MRKLKYVGANVLGFAVTMTGRGGKRCGKYEYGYGYGYGTDKASKKTKKKAAKSSPKTPSKSNAAPAAQPAASDSIIGTVCPVCGKGTIIKGKTAYGCSNWRNGCNYRISFDSATATPQNPDKA